MSYTIVHIFHFPKALPFCFKNHMFPIKARLGVAVVRLNKLHGSFSFFQLFSIDKHIQTKFLTSYSKSSTESLWGWEGFDISGGWELKCCRHYNFHLKLSLPHLRLLVVVLPCGKECVFYLFFSPAWCRRRVEESFSVGAEAGKNIILFGDIEWNRRVTCAASECRIDLRAVIINWKCFS